MAGAFAPRRLRYRFTHCVRATATTAVGGDVWARSLGDELLDPDCTADGYVWGVRWQVLYPGIRLVPATRETRRWQRRLGIPFHEARVGTNGHDLTLVFSDLRVEEMEVGASPFVVD